MNNYGSSSYNSVTNSGSGSSSGTSSGSDAASGKYTKYINIALAILAIVILLFLIGSYYNHKKTTDDDQKEHFFQNNVGCNQQPLPNEGPWQPGPTIESTGSPVKASQELGKNEVFASVPAPAEDKPAAVVQTDSHTNQFPTDTYPKDTLSSKELLPSDPNSKWAQVNPAGQGELGDQNFLEAGFHIGTNTIGQTLRNPNLQLRSEPPNPQLKVSPWMQSTMEPDVNRKPMEIGGC